MYILEKKSMNIFYQKVNVKNTLNHKPLKIDCNYKKSL